MAIVINKSEPNVTLSRAEYEQYRREYERSIMCMVDPPLFEVWVYAHLKRNNEIDNS